MKGARLLPANPRHSKTGGLHDGRRNVVLRKFIASSSC